MDPKRALALAVAVAAVALAPAPAGAATYVRVLTQRAKVYTGPGASYRTIYVAERGAVFPVLERGSRDYWLRIELEDGTTGWVYGEQVIPFEIVDDDDPGFFVGVGRAIDRAILGPSPIPTSDVELSFSAGIVGGEGLFLFRPAWIIDPYFALEAYAGESPRAQETLYMAGAGWTLRLAPGAPVGPYIHASAGVARFQPKADAFALDPKTLASLDVGGGFEITLKKLITLRIDFRNWTFFDQNEAANAQEYSGGLAIFF